MSTPRIVPAFDEVEDGEARVGLRVEGVAIEQLALERREEALAHGVVVGIAHTAHRRPDAGLATAPAEGERRVLAALIRVMNHRGRSALRDGHVERGQDELGAEMGFHRPADDAATPRVEHDGEIQEAARREFSVDARRAVRAARHPVNRVNVRRQLHIGPRPRRQRSLPPRVVPAGGDTQHAAHGGDRMDGLVCGHELESLDGIALVSRANQAAAFERIARSSRSCRFSRRSRRSSSCSSVVRPSVRWPASSAACFTQFRIAWAEGSNSRPSSSGVRPCRTNSIICRRNAGGYARWLFGIVDAPFRPNHGVSTQPGQLHLHQTHTSTDMGCPPSRPHISQETLSGAATARERIMHGSDWMMVAIQANADAYYEDFQGVFQGVEKKSPGVTKQFFVANAVPTSVWPPAALRASASTNNSVAAAGRRAGWTTRR